MSLEARRSYLTKNQGQKHLQHFPFKGLGMRRVGSGDHAVVRKSGRREASDRSAKLRSKKTVNRDGVI
jgi:hypothetical protein